MAVFENRPAIGVGACVVGQPVRYNGESKRRNPHLQALQDVADLRPFCPEMAIGLGVPRQPVRLVGTAENQRLMDSDTQTRDFSEPTRAYAAWLLEHNHDLAGYVLVKGSPSCGLQRVKRYHSNGQVAAADATGLFAAELQRIQPLLPVEEDGRLYDHRLRENFITRVYAWSDWLRLRAEPISHGRLIAFWSRYKYLVMAHHIPSYQQLGRLLSNGKLRDDGETADRFINIMMEALKHPASRAGYSNALQHVRGYLKQHLTAAEKRSVDDAIERYRLEQVPLVVPFTLLKHLFAQHHDTYIAQQAFMFPYPEQLGLRNHI